MSSDKPDQPPPPPDGAEAPEGMTADVPPRATRDRQRVQRCWCGLSLMRCRLKKTTTANWNCRSCPNRRVTSRPTCR